MLHILQYRRNYHAFLLICLIATAIGFGFAFLSPIQALASSATVDDQARVLDASKVQAEAAKLSYATLIYTINTFSGDQDALNQATRGRLPDQESLVIGIDVAQHHLSIESGTSVEVPDSQASDAVDAFRSNFNNGDYTGATIAAIDSLSGSNSSNIGGIVIAIVVVLVVLVVIIAVVRRRRGGNNWGGSRGERRYGGVYEGALIGESIHHHHHHTGSSFGGGGGGSFGGGGGGSF